MRDKTNKLRDRVQLRDAKDKLRDRKDKVKWDGKT